MTSTSAAVAGAYDALADSYDDLTEGYDYDTWLAALVEAAERHGLRGRRVLDVACGTGKSFVPMLERGYSVTGCDVSGAMLAHARARGGAAVRLRQADMCALPRLGCFDLVTCLDDSLNYVLDRELLHEALRGMRRVLAPRGLIVLDVNSLLTYRTSFAETWVRPSADSFIAWQGHASRAQAPETIARATITVFRTCGVGVWSRRHSEHTQRHWPPPTLRETAGRAGLEVKQVLGQLPGAVLEDTLDEARHHKIVLVLAARD
jgi:ubiquinone/menaquinone biosynthesis C-methylase UbiE